MHNAYEIGRAFVRMFFRDRVNLFFTFFFNAFLMILLGLTVADRFNLQVKLGVADLAQTEQSRALAERLGGESKLRLVSFPTEEALSAGVREGGLVAGIVIAEAGGAETASAAGRGTRIRLYADPSRKMWLDMLRPGLALSILEADPAAREALERVSITATETPSRNLRYIDFLFPGVIAFSIMQLALGGGLTLLRHRKNEALKRLKITPLERWEFLLGYAGSQLFVLVLQVLVYWGVTVALFGYTVEGSLLHIGAAILLGGLLFIAFGLVVSTLSPSTEAGGNLVRFLTFPAAFLCGVYVPLDALPDRLARFSWFYPLTPFVDAVRSAANYGAAPAQNAASFAMMAAALVVFSAIALKTFRWEEQAA